MAQTVFCKGFFQDILNSYKNYDLRISLLNTSTPSEIMGSGLLTKSEINSYIISGTEKVITGKTVNDIQLDADSVEWLNVTLSTKYAVMYDNTSERIIFFINFGNTVVIENNNFSIDFSNGLIKLQ